MSQRSAGATKAAAPPVLRLVHAIVFLGFASAAMAGTHQELLQLWRVLTQSYNAGTPPLPIACASGLVAAFGALFLIARVGFGKTVPLRVSALLLLAFLGSLTVLTAEPKQRTVPGANVTVLEKGKELHLKLNEGLQKTGTLSSSPEAFTLEGVSPFHKRLLTSLPWRVEKVNRTDALPDGAQPGWLLVQPSADLASYVITCVGIDSEGEPSLLRQEGNPIEYRGAYNPDAPR